MPQITIIGQAILKRKNDFFSLDQIVRDTGLDRLPVLRYMEELCRDRILKRTVKCPRTWKKREKVQDSFSMIFRADREKLAARIGPRLRENTSMDKMWSVVRNKIKLDGCLTIGDLVTLAEAKREYARWFLKMLRRSGVIRPSKPSGPGVCWTFIKDPGPQRPYLGDVALWKTSRSRRRSQKTGAKRPLK
jgi:hypothetical protein